LIGDEDLSANAINATFYDKLNFNFIRESRRSPALLSCPSSTLLAVGEDGRCLKYSARIEQIGHLTTLFSLSHHLPRNASTIAAEKAAE
jgi:hypothetical protein